MTQEKNIINHRPTWDEYSLTLAFTVSLRSDDNFIKHGAIIVDNLSKHIIGTGYNNTMRKAKTWIINMNDRDYRRQFMIHAEENAIINCHKNPLELKDGATIYITGLPCINCLQRIINFGITRIVMAEKVGSINEDKEIRQTILNMNKIPLQIDKIPLSNKYLYGINDFLSCIK